MTITIFLLFCFPDGCSQWLHPRKHVVCYFEGKRSVTSLNACLCTHLIYTNVGLNPEAKLDITNGKSSKVFNYGHKIPQNPQTNATPARTHSYKRTKISSLEIDIFGLKMRVKSGLEFFYFEIERAPSEIPANLLGQFSLSGQIFLHWAAATIKAIVEFQNIFF